MPIRAIKKEKGRGYLTPFSIPMIYEKLHCKGEPYHSIQTDLRNRHTQGQTTFLLLLYKEKWQEYNFANEGWNSDTVWTV